MMRMDKLTDRLPGIIMIHDDIYVFGSTLPQEHDHNLLRLIKTAECNSHIFRSKNVPSGSTRSPFTAVFTQYGMKPNLAKVQSLQDLPTPDSQKNYNHF